MAPNPINSYGLVTSMAPNRAGTDLGPNSGGFLSKIGTKTKTGEGARTGKSSGSTVKPRGSPPRPSKAAQNPRKTTKNPKLVCKLWPRTNLGFYLSAPFGAAPANRYWGFKLVLWETVLWEVVEISAQ